VLLSREEAALVEIQNFSCLLKVKNYREPLIGSMEVKVQELNGNLLPQTPGLEKKTGLLQMPQKNSLPL